MKKAILACTLAAASIGAQAQQATEKPLHFVAGVGLTYGGDKLATTYYTNGSKSNIRAGSGAQFLLGVDYRVNPMMSVQANVGAHIRFTPEADNGDADFRRFPIELLAYYHPSSQWRVGGGVRLVTSPKLNGSGAAAGLDRKFKNTTGAVLEAEYFATPRIGVKIRGAAEKYELEGGSKKISGNHLGLFGNFYF